MNPDIASPLVIAPYPIETVIINILLSFALALIIAWVYVKTHKGLSYSQSFTTTITLLPVITTVIMMVIGSSLARAFALLGAFTIIRFRTPVKETKDMAFLFFGLTVGMAVGTDNIQIAATATVLISLIIFVLSKLHFGSLRKLDFMLSFYFAPDKSGNYQNIFEKFLKNNTLLNMSSHDQGKLLEMVFTIRLMDPDQEKEFLSALHATPGVTNVKLINTENDLEY